MATISATEQATSITEINSMPTPGRFPYKKLPSYSRLRPEDVIVWEKFIDANPSLSWEVDYDVKVGLGRETLPELQEKYAKDWRDLTRKRIDVVAWSRDEILLIELKGRAGLSAVGQVLGYSELWVDLHDAGRRVRPVLICLSTDPDTLRVANAAGLVVVQLEVSAQFPA